MKSGPYHNHYIPLSQFHSRRWLLSRSVGLQFIPPSFTKWRFSLWQLLVSVAFRPSCRPLTFVPVLSRFLKDPRSSLVQFSKAAISMLLFSLESAANFSSLAGVTRGGGSPNYWTSNVASREYQWNGNRKLKRFLQSFIIFRASI
ncbi:hypothetical protein SLA2020_070620 [Shorea laevis]